MLMFGMHWHKIRNPENVYSNAQFVDSLIVNGHDANTNFNSYKHIIYLSVSGTHQC